MRTVPFAVAYVLAVPSDRASQSVHASFSIVYAETADDAAALVRSAVHAVMPSATCSVTGCVPCKPTEPVDADADPLAALRNEQNTLEPNESADVPTS